MAADDMRNDRSGKAAFEAFGCLIIWFFQRGLEQKHNPLEKISKERAREWPGSLPMQCVVCSEWRKRWDPAEGHFFRFEGLSTEEMTAVNHLTEMGFDRMEGLFGL